MKRIWKLRQSYDVKRWWRNMDNQTMYYRHMGEDFDIYTNHMNHKCRFDRLGVCPRVIRW